MTEPEPDIPVAGRGGAPAVRVLLADVEGGARRALAALITDIPGATLAGQVDRADDVTGALRRLKADVLVLDDRLIQDHGGPLAGSLPDGVRLIVVGMDDTPMFAARALALGAEAWIPKEFADDELRELLESP